MKKKIVGICVSMLLLATTLPVVGNPTITAKEKNIRTQGRGSEWNFTYSDGEFDEIRHIAQTTDGGYICCGLTEESNNYYILLLKLRANGTEEWHIINYNLNGTSVTPLAMDVIAFHIIQTADGGFLVSGVSTIYIEQASVWFPVGFLWKTTSTGTTQWVQHFYNIEETAVDYIYYSAELPTGGYVSTGHRIYVDPMSGQVIDFNGFLVKTNNTGVLQWQKIYAYEGYEHLSSLCFTNDSGFLLTGWRESNSIHNGALWMVKTNKTGNQQWNQTFDGHDFEYTYGKGCFQTSDGGYMICGNTQSYGAGAVDAWVIRTDAAGNQVWNRTFGFTQNDYTWCMTNMSNGDYVLAICKDYMNNGGTKDDILIVEFNDAGDTEWSYLIEQPETQIPTCIQQTKDEGFIIAGRTEEYGTTTSDGIAIKIGPFPHFNITFKGGLGLHVTISNTGKGDAQQIPYKLSVKGGLFGLINETKNGTIDLLAGNHKAFLGLYLRIGKVTIDAKVAEKQKTVTGFLLGPFVFVK